MTGFTEIFGGLGALLGFLFSLGFSIQGQSGLNLISNMDLFTSNPSEYTKGVLILLAIVQVCGAVGALLGAFLDGFNRK